MNQILFGAVRILKGEIRNPQFSTNSKQNAKNDEKQTEIHE